MKKKIFRERYVNEGVTIINKGINFKVDPIEDEEEKKPVKRGRKSVKSDK